MFESFIQDQTQKHENQIRHTLVEEMCLFEVLEAYSEPCQTLR